MKFIARHYKTQQLLQIEIKEKKYSRLKILTSSSRTIPWIAPSLVDIQINGFGGMDFNRPISEQDWQKVCQILYKQGCTHFLATLITNSTESLEILLKNLEKLFQQNSYNCMGFHLEGPFLNPHTDYHGVHNPAWMKPCNLSLFKKWQSVSNNAIRLITLAPEIEPQKSLPFIRYLTQQNIRVAIGHSSATDTLLQQAIKAGATGWTHLGNGLPQKIHKFENPIFHALAQPELFCSLIPDGIHLPPHVFSVLAKALKNRLLLTTDATAAAGAAAGHYTLGEIEITRSKEGQARQTKTQKLAGSTLTPFETVFRAAQLSNKPWQEMWDAYSTRPAQWLGLNSHAIEKNNEANFCLVTDQPHPHLLATVHQGKCVFGEIEN
ncbi:MAG: N-acetylglucosamine-6-phosphate deacetylase [Verrucomicrobiia bacterium]